MRAPHVTQTSGGEGILLTEHYRGQMYLVQIPPSHDGFSFKTSMKLLTSPFFATLIILNPTLFL